MPSRRLRLVLAPAFCLPLLFSAAAGADDLTIAIADEPLFVIKNDDGSYGGFNIELAQALCADMQATCTLQPMPADALLPALAARQADAAIAVPQPADDAPGIVFSERYYKYGARFTRKTGETGRISYKSMAGRNVAVVQDSLYERFLSDKFSGVNVKRYPDIAAAYAALAAGEAEYVLDGRVAQLLRAAQEEYETAGPSYSTAKYFSNAVIAVRAPPLRDRLNNALRAARKSGVYQSLSKKHFGFDIYGR